MSEMVSAEQLEYPFGKKVEVRFGVETPGGVCDLVYLDGEIVPRQTSLAIESDMDFRHLEFTVIHFPSAQEIVVSGYVVSGALLNWYYQRNLERHGNKPLLDETKPEGFGGYLIEDDTMQSITEALNAAPPEGLRDVRSHIGTPRPDTKLRVGA